MTHARRHISLQCRATNALTLCGIWAPARPANDFHSRGQSTWLDTCHVMQSYLWFFIVVSLKDLSAILLKAIVVWCDHGKDNTKYTFKDHPPPFWPHTYLNSISCFSPTMSIRAAVKTGNRHYQRENCHHWENCFGKIFLALLASRCYLHARRHNLGKGVDCGLHPRSH